MTWSETEFAGVPLKAFAPPGARFTVLFLHDFDEQFPTDGDDLTTALAAHALACVAPAGGQSLWSDRPFPRLFGGRTAEQFLTALGTATPLRAALGVGIGGQAAVRLGLKYPDRFPVVAGWDSAFDFHDRHGRGTPLDGLYDRKEQARQDTAVLQVRPPHVPPHIWFGCSPESEWYRGNDRLHEKLSAVGVPHTFAADEPQPVAAMVAFVADGLARQARRLL